MSQRWFPAGALLVGLLLLGLKQSRPSLSMSKPSIAPRVAASPSLLAPDTIRSTTTTERPVIRSLPAHLDDTPVSRYTILEGPALSGVAGRSFAWIPQKANPGTYDVRLQAQHPDAPADTLVLRIDVQS